MRLLTRESQSDRARPLGAGPPALRWYFAAVIAAATAGLVLVAVATGWDQIRWTFTRPALWVLLLLIVAADSYPLLPWMRDVQGRVRVHWSAALSLAAVLAFGPATVLVFPFVTLIAVSSLGGAWWRKIFNVAVVVLEGLFGVGVLVAIWGPFDRGHTPTAVGLLLSGLTLAVVWELVNVTLIAAAQTLTGASSWRQAVRWCLRLTVMWFAALTAAPMIAGLALAAPALLPLLIVVVVAMHHNIAGSTRTRDLARTDPLTGLANRAAAMAVLERRLGLRHVRATEVLMMLIDLDGFKAVNDTFGHQAGDDLLVAVAARIREQAPEDSLVARLGGDEFVIVDGTVADPAGLAERVSAAVALPVQIGESSATVSCSIGWASSLGEMDPMDLFRQVDRDLYRLKNGRRGDPGRRLNR